MISRRPVALLFLVFLVAAAPSSSPAAPNPPVAAAAPNPPLIYTMALPARIAFIAWLPASKDPGALDLDLRTDVVLPEGCGDQVVGLMRRGGPKLDGPDEWDVVISRKPVGECKKDAIRISARSTIRMRVPDGAERTLLVGERSLKIARKGKVVTVDGQEAEGDVPGAPPTARPTTLVQGDVTHAQAGSVTRDALDAHNVSATITVDAKWPACASAPLGFLARGDASTHYSLLRLTPLARAPLDEPCKGATSRSADINLMRAVSKKAGALDLTVGPIALSLKLGAPTQPVPVSATQKADASAASQGARP